MPGTKKKSKKNNFKRITTLNDLSYNCSETANPENYDKYRQLAIISAKNLGCGPNPTYEQALRCLEMNAMETDEGGVVGEINFCLDLVE